MTRLFAGGTSLAVALAFGMIASAQTPSQTPSQSQQPTTASKPTQTSPAGDSVTLVGCVQREDDYRKAHNLGRGGAVGTGVGVGNEYVLVNASKSTAAGTSSTGAAAGAATGTTGGTAGDAYELTGTNENQVGQYVGKRVEIAGKLKPAEAGPAGPTGGATAGAPPRGVDTTSPDLKLRELEVTSVREATGTCPSTQG